MTCVRLWPKKCWLKMAAERRSRLDIGKGLPVVAGKTAAFRRHMLGFQCPWTSMTAPMASYSKEQPTAASFSRRVGRGAEQSPGLVHSFRPAAGTTSHPAILRRAKNIHPSLGSVMEVVLPDRLPLLLGLAACPVRRAGVDHEACERGYHIANMRGVPPDGTARRACWCGIT